MSRPKFKSSSSTKTRSHNRGPSTINNGPRQRPTTHRGISVSELANSLKKLKEKARAKESEIDREIDREVQKRVGKELKKFKKSLPSLIDEELEHLKLQAQIDRIQDNLYGFMSDVSMGLRPSKSKIHRYVPVRFYFSDMPKDKVADFYKALHSFLEAFELQPALGNYNPRFGSFWEDVKGVTWKRLTREQLEEKLQELEDTVRLYIEELPQSQIDKNKAEATAALLSQFPVNAYGAFQVGFLLVINDFTDDGKPTTQAFTLSAMQVMKLNRNPHMIHTTPEQLLELLAENGPEDDSDKN